MRVSGNFEVSLQPLDCSTVSGEGKDSHLTLEVVPDSATGELCGITGQMSIEMMDNQHRHEFVYQL